MAICGRIVSWPAWQRWVFKPLTLILLLLLAWQAPMFDAISYLVLAGPVRLVAGRCVDAVAAPTSAVRHWRILPVAPAVHPLFRQPDDAVVLLAIAVSAAGVGRVADCGDLDASGRAALADMHFYRHDAHDGLAGR